MKMISLLDCGITHVIVLTLLFVSSIEGNDSFISTPLSGERMSSFIEKVDAPTKENAPAPLLSIESLDTWMIEMLDLVNEERSKVGASPLCYNQKIIDAADKHSHDMEEKNYFSHTGKDGSSPGDRIERENYEWSSYGENIAWGQGSVVAVMNAWMNSSGHRANILSGSKTHFGAGWAKSSNKWTQKFTSTWDDDEECVSANTPTASPVNPPTASPVSPPTLSPVSPPTKSPVNPPTESPVSAPTKCEDTKAKFKLKIFNKKKEKFQTYRVKCKKVGKKKYCDNKDHKGKYAFEKCPVTCGKC